jgi:hypothetical protein
MIAFASLLVPPAEQAGIKIPDVVSDDNLTYDPKDYPHWHIFCNAQLGTPMPSADAHWNNAHVVASLSEFDTKVITMKELVDRGFSIGYSR